jgi:hypothetical protein
MLSLWGQQAARAQFTRASRAVATLRRHSTRSFGHARATRATRDRVEATAPSPSWCAALATVRRLHRLHRPRQVRAAHDPGQPDAQERTSRRWRDDNRDPGRRRAERIRVYLLSAGVEVDSALTVAGGYTFQPSPGTYRLRFGLARWASPRPRSSASTPRPASCRSSRTRSNRSATCRAGPIRS